VGIGIVAFPPNLSFPICVRHQPFHPKFGLHRHGSLPCQNTHLMGIAEKLSNIEL